MKKIAMLVAVALLTGSAFAQGMGRGPGPDQDIAWKVGTVVTTEYKKVVGTIQIGQTLAPTFKTDGVEYQLRLPRLAELGSLKNGDSLTIEGTFTTVKSDTKTPPMVHAFKITVAGKEIDLSSALEGRGGMMRGDRDDRGEGNPFGPRR